MMFYKTLSNTLTLLLGALCALTVDRAKGADRPPNVIVIVADDMGYADVGVHGCADIPTPHIDSLAANGVRCTNGYVSHSFCSPTRAGLLTGRYQQRFGHEYNTGPISDRRLNVGLPTDETTFADRMRSAGYVTGIVGKWHLGHTEEKYHPRKRGFDEFFGFLAGSHSYLNSGTGAASIHRNEEAITEEAYLTDAFAREGVAFVERHHDKPFFLYWPFNAVHTPMEATEQYRARFPDIQNKKRMTYAAMLSAMDDAIGQLLATLKEHELEEDTLLIFISDNGGPEQVNGSDNGPLRGTKGTVYEGGIRTPFLVQWTGHLPAGGVYEHPVIQLDILPTALAAADVADEANSRFDGVNLLPHLQGDNTEPPHEALFWRSGPQLAVRQGDWKLVKMVDRQRRRNARGDGDRNAEREQQATVEGAELYNLKSDVGEETDLAKENPEKFQELAASWNEWNGTNVEPLWGPPVRDRAKRPRRER